MTRTEQDFIGKVQIPKNHLYGIQSLRAKENFPDTSRFHKDWYCAIGKVKSAVYLTYHDFIDALKKKYQPDEINIKILDTDVLESLITAASEVSNGKHFENFIVPAISGGAGTSINMNINEIIANRALQIMGYETGRYDIIDPINEANIYQSTNDVVPTALKVAAMELLTGLEESINLLRYSTERIEKEHRNSLRTGYTQMQQAVPTSYGKLFSTYCDALSRDWWRVSKCWERIKMINLGGSAIGTGIAIPRFMVMQTARRLQQITGLPLNRAENMCDATSNLDAFVEVHAILKAHAVNLEKMSSDIRLLASDINNSPELSIPQKQIGSTIMPGKVNPVICEYVISAAHKIYANDQLITSLSAQGCLELNAYLPVIGHALIESIRLLITADQTLHNNLIEGITIDTKKAYEHLIYSPSVTTALVPHIGYHQAAKLAKEMQSTKCHLFKANQKLKLIDNNKLERIIEPSNLLKEGFSIKDFE